jgi:hypothetical protein
MLSCVYVRGVSNPCVGSKILTFPFRSQPVCSSLLHLRSSWKYGSLRSSRAEGSRNVCVDLPMNWYILAGYASLPRRGYALDETTKVG